MKRILVLGAGFAGLWAAVGAARRLDELRASAGDVEIVVVNRDSWHSIRVRNYEADLGDVRVPLDDVLGPIGVRRIEGEATGIDLANRNVTVQTGAGAEAIAYDRLVLAAGSQVVQPAFPFDKALLFDVDTYDNAACLNAHVAALGAEPLSEGRWTVVVIGSGLTGLEAATEMTAKLKAAIESAHQSTRGRVVLVDGGPIGGGMGESAAPVIAEALASLGVETRAGAKVAAVDRRGVSLASGEFLPASTVVWCAGVSASPLCELFPVERDRFGRLPVDEFLRVKGIEGAFAAGDCAAATMDDEHMSVMSCQHGRPMGRFAGYNVVSDLLNQAMLPLHIDKYVTILDLGDWGALYTEGWDRKVVTTGEAAKKTKRLINRERIYPPLNRDRGAILAAAAPIVQAPPQRYEKAD